MKRSKKKKPIPPALQQKILELEEKAGHKGIQIHYDQLEAAGLKLKGGICKINGEHHLFIDRRKSAAEKIEVLQEHVDNPLPEDIPENMPEPPPMSTDHEKETGE